MNETDEPKTNELTAKQEIFCRNYASQREFFGNGCLSYCDAYNLDYNNETDKRSATESASRLLRNVNICQRIHELLDIAGLNDEAVDKERLFVIKQHENLSAKIMAIKSYDEVKGRVKRKLEIDTPEGSTFNVKIIKEQDDGNKLGTN